MKLARIKTKLRFELEDETEKKFQINAMLEYDTCRELDHQLVKGEVVTVTAQLSRGERIVGYMVKTVFPVVVHATSPGVASNPVDLKAECVGVMFITDPRPTVLKVSNRDPDQLTNAVSVIVFMKKGPK